MVSSTETEIQLNRSNDLLKYVSTAYPDTPIFHPTDVTNNADLLLKIITENKLQAIVPLHRAYVGEHMLFFHNASATENGDPEEVDVDLGLGIGVVNDFFRAAYKRSFNLTADNAIQIHRLASHFKDYEILQATRCFVQTNPELFLNLSDAEHAEFKAPPPTSTTPKKLQAVHSAIESLKLNEVSRGDDTTREEKSTFGDLCTPHVTALTDATRFCVARGQDIELSNGSRTVTAIGTQNSFSLVYSEPVNAKMNSCKWKLRVENETDEVFIGVSRSDFTNEYGLHFDVGSIVMIDFCPCTGSLLMYKDGTLLENEELDFVPQGSYRLAVSLANIGDRVTILDSKSCI